MSEFRHWCIACHTFKADCCPDEGDAGWWCPECIKDWERKTGDCWADGTPMVTTSTDMNLTDTNSLTSFLRERYTSIQECCVEDTPDAHTVWLKVGSQRFCVTSMACDTKEDAEAFRDMLAHALTVLVTESLSKLT